MSDKISLTAPMRSGLLSLQSISKNVSLTQNILSTGLKVNSAIDNPSSYYTASSLNNRACDLNALLDSMGQAIQTIQAATQGLEASANILEQASVVAAKTLEIVTIPPQSWFEEQVGKNGAVVTTAQELKDAIAANKETICVYGKIDMGNDTLTLKKGQKLVGTEYFTGYTGKEKFSQINFEITQVNGNFALHLQSGGLISDLSLTLDTTSDKGISLIQADDGTNIHNVDLHSQIKGTMTFRSGAIAVRGSQDTPVKISGHNQIYAKGNGNHGIVCAPGFKAEYLDGSVTNISSDSANGVYIEVNATAEIKQGAEVNISVNSSCAIILQQKSKMDIKGNLNIENLSENSAIRLYGAKSSDNDNFLSFSSTANVAIKSDYNTWLNSGYMSDDLRKNTVKFEAGAKFAFYKDGTEQNYVSQGLELINDTSKGGSLTVSGMATHDKFAVSDRKSDVDWGAITKGLEANNELEQHMAQYTNVLNQHDTLIKDASYKGINLLKNDNLDVRFNETGDSILKISGLDASSSAIGLTTTEWLTQADVLASIRELTTALNNVRSMLEELGNSYSIIQTRQEFTDNLINILTEGADKLTLADMNEESANMLALQTRQQLATNALSLAQQASQSVLKLF